MPPPVARSNPMVQVSGADVDERQARLLLMHRLLAKFLFDLGGPPRGCLLHVGQIAPNWPPRNTFTRHPSFYHR
jgi:hypothetical protein